MKAAVNRIIPFSNVDGPGNRFALFLQSCPFSCLYCHNPETIRFCSHCGACVPTCPVSALSKEDGKVVWDQTKCVQCDTCLKTCPHLSSPKIRMMSAEEVMAEVMKVRPFIRGITVSGGECMNHAGFLLELFTLAKEAGLHCLLDSNGAHDFSLYPDLLAVTDGVMLDIKAGDSVFHQRLTGIDNQMVFKNARQLLEWQKLAEVRTVLFPFFNEENTSAVIAVSDLIQASCLYKLIAYRPFGVRKEGLEMIGDTITSEQEMQRCLTLAKAHGASQAVLI